MWTNAISIVIITPCLSKANLGFLRSICISYVHAVYFGSVTIYCFFRNRVLNLLTVFILGKIIEAPLPAVGCGNYKSLAFDLRSICEKLNLDGLRSLAILIVCVVPCLLT